MRIMGKPKKEQKKSSENLKIDKNNPT